MNDFLILLFMLVLVVGLSSSWAQPKLEELKHKRAEVLSYSREKTQSAPTKKKTTKGKSPVSVH